MFESELQYKYRVATETLGLRLCQMWGDAFMMYEDDYTFFPKTYRYLRGKMIKFPERKEEEFAKFMEQLQVIDSPVLEIHFNRQVKNKADEDKKPGSQSQLMDFEVLEDIIDTVRMVLKNESEFDEVALKISVELVQTARICKKRLQK